MYSFSCLNWDSFPPPLVVLFSFEQTCFRATVTQTCFSVRNICIIFKTIPSAFQRCCMWVRTGNNKSSLLKGTRTHILVLLSLFKDFHRCNVSPSP